MIFPILLVYLKKSEIWIASLFDRILSLKEDHVAMNYDNFSRMMSINNRGSKLVVIPELLGYVRAIFLEIIRVKYWQNIECEP